MIKFIYDLAYRHPTATANVVQISDDGLSIYYGMGLDRLCRTDHGIPDKSFKVYTEFTIGTWSGSGYAGPIFIIGVCDLSGTNVVGKFYHSHGGNDCFTRIIDNVEHNETNSTSLVSRTGDTVSQLIDPANNRIVQILNNTTTILDTTIDIDTDELYMSVFHWGSRLNANISVNLGASPFRYAPPEGYVSLEQIWNIGDIHHLKEKKY